MAFVMAAFSLNDISFKEFPTDVKTYDEWNADLPDDQEYRKFLREQVLVVSPLTGNDFKKGWLNV